MYVIMNIPEVQHKNSHSAQLILLKQADFDYLLSLSENEHSERVTSIELGIDFSAYHVIEFQESNAKFNARLFKISDNKVAYRPKTKTFVFYFFGFELEVHYTKAAMLIEKHPTLSDGSVDTNILKEYWDNLKASEKHPSWTETKKQLLGSATFDDYLNQLNTIDSSAMISMKDDEIAAKVTQITGINVDAYNYPLMSAIRQKVAFVIVELNEEIITLGTNTAKYQIARNNINAPESFERTVISLIDNQHDGVKLISRQHKIGQVASVIKQNLTITNQG